ncbi:MAG: insulinase family protein [Gemmatimonadetes bacterium]|nr:insulinase family protein [Gemmatimonadota bacterium]
MNTSLLALMRSAAPSSFALLGVFVLVFVLAGVAALAGQENEPIVYDVEGVRVVQLTLPDRELVSAHLYLLGGARQLTPRTAGIERLILVGSGRGTEGFRGDALREAQVSTGGDFFVTTDPDWSVLGFTGLAEEFDRSWAILADRLMRPTLDSAAVEIVRNQALTSVRASNEGPDAAVRLLAEQLAFDGHPYAADVRGTEESLTALSVGDLRLYHEQQFVRSRMLLSVVGAVDRSTVESAIRSTLASLPMGSYAWEMPEPWTKSEPNLLVEDRLLPTNYILGYFGGPTSTDDGYPAFQVAVSALSGLVSSGIRARGLSYSAGVRVVDRAAAGGGIYVSTTDPEEAMEIINDAVDFLKQGTIPRSALRDFAEGSVLSYHLANQTTSQQAEFLASSLLLGGRPQSVADWVEDLRRVSGNDLRREIREYVRNIQYAYLGNPRLVPRESMLEH